MFNLERNSERIDPIRRLCFLLRAIAIGSREERGLLRVVLLIREHRGGSGSSSSSNRQEGRLTRGERSFHCGILVYRVIASVYRLLHGSRIGRRIRSNNNMLGSRRRKNGIGMLFDGAEERGVRILIIIIESIVLVVTRIILSAETTEGR